MEPTIAEMLARIAQLEALVALPTLDATVKPKIDRVARKKLSDRQKRAEKARRAQFKADRWERSRRGKSLNRYAIS